MTDPRLPPGPDGQVTLKFRPGQIGVADQAWAIRMVDKLIPHAQEWLANAIVEAAAEAGEAGAGATIVQITYHSWYDEAAGLYCWYEEIVYSDGTVTQSETQCGPEVPHRGSPGMPPGSSPPDSA